MNVLFLPSLRAVYDLRRLKDRVTPNSLLLCSWPRASKHPAFSLTGVSVFKVPFIEKKFVSETASFKLYWQPSLREVIPSDSKSGGGGVGGEGKVKNLQDR